ncbi:MAG: RnfABCDGE type electron transport complex subunit G [Candidatus Aminicenantes bacterium]|nr:RnfABCDGE type electron transport complex subunit G [Candidatus Aminicenantes bacterium]
MADKKLPSTFANMVIVLTSISVVSALALAFTYSATKDAIAQVGVKRTLKALQQVLPEFNNDPTGEKYTVEEPEFKDMELYPARKDDQPVGTAVQTYSDNGYGGRILLMVGFDNAAKIIGISVLKQTETPGLGNKMVASTFKDQFKGKDPSVFKMMVRKDGGEVDAISAATISSRAFCDAVDRAYRALLKGGRK